MKNPLEGGKISAYQLFLLLFTTVIATGILFVPAITAMYADHDGWLSVLVVATIPGLITADVCIRLERRFPGQSIIQYSEIILGKFFGKFLGLLFIFFLILINAIIISESASFVTAAFLLETPQIIITASLMILAAYMVRNGIEVISRVNEITTILFFFIFILIIILVFHDIHIENLLPFFDKGIKAVILGGLPPSIWRTEVFVLTMILPLLDVPEKARKASFGAVILLALILAADTIVSFGVLGDIVKIETFPFLSLVRYISIAGFLDRIEAVVMVFWVSGVLIKIGVFYYVAVLGIAQLFNLKDYKPIVMPIGVLLTIWSIIIFESGPELVDFLATTAVTWALANQFSLPLILLIAAVFTGKRGVKGK